MNGRKIFEKYGKLISFLVKITKKLPHGIRTWILNVNRNKNGKVGMLLRYLAVSSLAKNVGKNVVIFPNVFFEYIENLSIGDNVSIHQMCYIDAQGGIDIGNNVSIAHRSTVLSSNHSYNSIGIPIKYQDMILNKTRIEDDVWIGCACIVLSGVTIATGSVIGGNSTVTHDVDAYSVVVGSPAHLIKRRM